jgi:hypothetical protein
MEEKAARVPFLAQNAAMNRRTAKAFIGVGEVGQ